MTITTDYVLFPGSATVGEVLRAYLERSANWWWLLVADLDGAHGICSFGSLLPYLTGRTSHIVHNIGDCPICTAMDPVLWSDTGPLVHEALADPAICARTVADLPLADLPVLAEEEMDTIDWAAWHRAGRPWPSTRGVTREGIFVGVYRDQVMKGPMGGMPDF